MEEPKKQSLFQKPWVQSVVGIVVVALLLGAVIVWKSLSSYVSIKDSLVSAPVINIGPQAAGILQEVYVKAGDKVTANEPVARVGSETLSAQVDGIVTSVQNTPGQVFQPGAAVITMIDPTQLRIVGTLAEDKGLADVKVGQPVTFTVDAFGNDTFTGIVDEVSPTSNQSGIVFSISDERAEQNFDVKVRYDVAAHPEFKNGMSAKIKVYIK
ncbi:MAG TPA: efflux RND transporter periplasmic adaptor subunit [Candidatus Paceibacterota bacterium]|jgi:multidrug resistance efflux pump|nr:efflux RND transporter periplasmic adaptor subunit [Candidatus Paceibacterota bacterium]